MRSFGLLPRAVEFRKFATDRNVMAATAIVLAGIIVYWPTWVSLADNWALETSTNSHGFPIAMISFYLIIRSVWPPSLPDSQYSSLSAGGLLIASAAWLVSYFSNVMVIQAAVLPVIFFLALVTLFGVRSARGFIFPLGFFYFAVPFWSSLTTILQAMTIDMSGRLLGVLRIPAAIEGSFVFLPDGTFEIADGCAGLNFFVVALAIGSLYAHQNLRGGVYRAIFIGITIALALLANWLRVTTIVVAGHLTKMQHYLVTVDHYTFGWILFIAILLPIFFVGGFLEKLESRRCRLNTRADSAKAAGVDGQGVPMRRVGFVITVLAVVPLLGLALDHRAGASQTAHIEFPQSAGDWRWQSLSATEWKTKFTGAAEEVYGRYILGTKTIELYANVYIRQRQGAELINSTNSLFDGSVWREHSRTTYSLNLENGNTLDLIRLDVVGRGGRRQQYLYWYLVDDKAMINALEVKMEELWQRIAGRAASGIFAVRVDCGLDCDDGLEAEIEFLRSHIVEINKHAFATSG